MKTSTITASEANRSFSRLLRAVEQGERVEITSHGRKVAVLAPFEQDIPTRDQRLAALAKLKARWAAQTPITVGPWSREDLNGRD